METAKKVFDVSFGQRREDNQTRWWNEEVRESEGKDEVSIERCDSRGAKVEKSYWEAACTAKREVAKTNGELNMRQKKGDVHQQG